MKKIKSIAALISVAAMSVNTFADISINYINDSITTTAENYSLAGQCDPNYPLYINGEKTDATKDGYFCKYTGLKIGENIFNFENTSASKTYTIIRKEAESSSFEDKFTPVDFVGEVDRNNPTVRSRPDEANDDLITPYAKGTVVKIVAENSEYYKTSNGNYLYKQVIEKTDKKYGGNIVKNIDITDFSIEFEVSSLVEYAVDMTSDSIKITLYDSTDNTDLSLLDSEIFSSVNCGGKTNPSYTFKFKDSGSFIGYKPVMHENKMTFILNKRASADINSLNGTTVVLDAGHGGDESGTLGLGKVQEKTVNLAVTNLVKDYLESKGAKIVLARPEDKTVALNERTALIDSTMPDASVSIHCNSMSEWTDYNIYTGMRLFNTFDSASGFENSMSESLGVKCDKSNLALTRITTCPSLLIEIGFMSNPEEYENLLKDSTQREIAEKIGKGIEKYLLSYKKDSSTDNNKSIKIYHTNDIHGYVCGNDKNVVGIDKAAALKNSTPNSLLVDAGDATQGLPIASLTKGTDIIELMNLAGYDVMAVGNHEFDFGSNQLLENAKKASFPMLAANIYKENNLLLKDIPKSNTGCHKIIEKNGIKIGFFGLTTSHTASATNPYGIKGIKFKDEIESAKREIDELNNENADIIIAICHIGNGANKITSEKLAQAMTGKYQGKLDVIIDGHSHTVENTVKNDVLIVQTGSSMSSVGELTVNIDDDNITFSDRLLGVNDLSSISGDKKISDKITEINKNQSNILLNKIGTAETTLWAGQIGSIIFSRLVETNFGDLSADAFKYSAEKFIAEKGINLPVCAVENGGGIRESIPNGDITEGSLIAAFPFSNTLYIKEITPANLYEIMEISGSLLDGIDSETGMLLQENTSGGFLQISGFKVIFDADSKEQKVKSITLDGESKPLDRNDTSRKIIIAGNNFIMNGGNNYTILGSIPLFGEIGGEVETIRAYIENNLDNGILKGYNTCKNRIIIQGGYKAKDYTVKIKITDKNEKPLANKALSYRIDGGERINAATDSSGILSVKVSDGAHGIKLSDNQKEIYVNNYTGIGIIEDALRVYPTLEFEANEGSNAIQNTTEEIISESTTQNTDNTLSESTSETAKKAVPSKRGKSSYAASLANNTEKKTPRK